MKKIVSKFFLLFLVTIPTINSMPAPAPTKPSEEKCATRLPLNLEEILSRPRMLPYDGEMALSLQIARLDINEYWLSEYQYQAAKYGYLGAFITTINYFDRSFDVNQIYRGYSMLSIAAYNRHYNVCNFILQHRYFNKKDLTENALLLGASHSGMIDIVRMCLDAGVNINYRQVPTNNSALLNAAKNKHRAVCALLLARGATHDGPEFEPYRQFLKECSQPSPASPAAQELPS